MWFYVDRLRCYGTLPGPLHNLGRWRFRLRARRSSARTAAPNMSKIVGNSWVDVGLNAPTPHAVAAYAFPFIVFLFAP